MHTVIIFLSAFECQKLRDFEKELNVNSTSNESLAFTRQAGRVHKL